MEYYIGQTASILKHISDETIRLFADVSGDHNPVHLDEEYAAKTIFGRRIAHGMLSASLISTVLGTKFPGPGTIYLAQNLEFKKPVFLDDIIEVKVTVVAVHPEKRVLELQTVCCNQAGEDVLVGTARVKYPK